MVSQREMTCGAPQGSRVCPLVWNVMYDDFLRMDLPAGTSIIGFADDALVVCAADLVKILELRINDSLWRAKRWLDSTGLKMGPKKTQALLVTDRRFFQYPKIALGEHEIEWKKSHAILKKLFSAQRGVVMRIVSAYRSVSTSAVSYQ